ncbi:hypothetical protein FOZG_13689 [Fusarium oxysporum Fo47]|uniref:Uncharacterized protein n=3 Tax=Fusarium oxysporum TaxID=5507 RepID=W9JPK1_FUSOX|nr:hypothetical protein FOZG_13689 [Fusarium oxysporum Fo47]
MGIYTRGRSKAINSPRHLTLRHARRSVATSKFNAGLTETHEDPPPLLKPGEEKLNSFWAPGLEAGPAHLIKATQTIKSPNPGENDIKLVSKQTFYVDAPQFSLPEDSVYSTYPPPGYSDDHRILPHVVLSDPHLPWERRGSPKDDKKTPKDERNKVPWLILLTFTEDELKLKPDDLGTGNTFKQTVTLSVKTTVGDVQDLTTKGNVVSPISEILDVVKNDTKETDKIRKSQGEFIFMKPDLFKSVFSNFDNNNERQVPASPDTNKFKYLSHVRNINTAGMAVAGVEEVGVFSVVVGSRSGPLTNKAPATASVHLLSIEGVEGMSSFPADDKLVALCSLHSWNYTVMPPGMLNVFDAFTSLGETLDVLRPPEEIIKEIAEPNDELGKRLAARLTDGYSMVKYCTQTGEHTVALFRGPFTPSVVLPNEYLNICSNSGQNLQILDREVGIMDISYSVAWQVGRTMALGDPNFCGALSRFRTAIHQGAMKEAKIKAVQSAAGGSERFRQKADILANLSQTIKHLERMHLNHQDKHFQLKTPSQKWLGPRLGRKAYPALGFNASKIKDDYLDHAKKVAEDLALSTDGVNIYDETNDPVSEDWKVILAWVMDRMFLAGVPAHYLITDPSHLEHERLKFFYVDPNWVDAMIDGGLSLANHMGEDRDREAIKHIINNYVKHKAEHQLHTPQIPSYGFYLRSDLVTMFPDLKVETLSKAPKKADDKESGDNKVESLSEPPKEAHPKKAPLLRHNIIADGVMLALLDRHPGSDDFKGLLFTQPPHQQRFAVGHSLSDSEIGISLRRQYTVSQEIRETDKHRHDPLQKFTKTRRDRENWFIWSTEPGSQANDVRMLRLPYFAEQQIQILQNMPKQENGEKYFDDIIPNSALLAMQLDDPYYEFAVPFKDKLAGLGPAPTEFRTLNMTGHARVMRLAKHDDDLICRGDETSEPSDSESSPVDTPASSDDSPFFERHEEYSPAAHVLRHNIAPHVRQPHVDDDGSHVSRFHSAISTSGSGGGPSNVPSFNCDIYSPGKDAIHVNKKNLPDDLVFSVLVSGQEYSNEHLIEFDILVKLGPATDKHTKLMESYDGPGPRMLSNLRFNILTAIIEKNGMQYLKLRLLPRNAIGYVVANRMSNEVSFLLCLAKVNIFEKPEVLVMLETEAHYVNRPQVFKDTFTIMVKNDSL